VGHGITNAFNIIDVMDGLAHGHGLHRGAVPVLIASLAGGDPSIAVHGHRAGRRAGGLPALQLHAGAHLPGDTGSLFIGF
jgi:UDP-N-acetylmuramyl pentapeptide phosphotransferase/UDP-N-acetylglucosamine-1-phosphate transferase